MTLAEATAITEVPNDTFEYTNIKHFYELKYFGIRSGKTNVVNCSMLETVSAPIILESTHNYANNCKILRWAELHENVQSLGEWCFTNLPQIKTIICHARVAPRTSGNGWYGIKSGGTIYVPQGSTGYESGYWKSKFIDNGWTISYTL